MRKATLFVWTSWFALILGVTSWNQEVLCQELNYGTVNAVKLTWTAPGDNANSGQAASYDVRCHLENINDLTWRFAIKLQPLPHPMPAGDRQTLYITGLWPNHNYYFAIKTFDSAGNESPMSNVVMRRPQQYTFICGDFDDSGYGPDISDLAHMIAFLYHGGNPPPILDAADFNGDGNFSISDISYFVKYLYQGGPSPVCP